MTVLPLLWCVKEEVGGVVVPKEERGESMCAQMDRNTVRFTTRIFHSCLRNLNVCFDKRGKARVGAGQGD